MNLTQITAKLSPRGWLAVGGSAAAALVFLYLLFNMASAPSYSTLMAGVDPSQTGKITSALSTAGIPYQLQNGGTAVAVASADVAQARVALAGQGLLSSTGTGSSALTSFANGSNLGQSNFQQLVAYEGALEKQLDSTIPGVQGVTAAQVQIALPNPADQLFNATQQSPSASVLLTDTGSLSSAQVKGIAEMVASAVPGLSSQKVTITDQTGQLLWPGSSSGSNGLLAKQSVQAAYDQQTASQLDAMLAATLGPGKAVVQVAADLNANQTSIQSVSYAKKGTPLTTTTSKETLTGTSPTTPAGTTTIPSYASSGSGNSKYLNTSSQTDYGVNKQVVSSTVAPGAINRQSVSVLVSKTVPAAELKSIRSAVVAAIGLNTKRGDTISVAQIAFAPKPPVAAATGGSSTTKMLGYAKYLAIGLGALLFLLFISRSLRKRENEAFAGTPKWLRELENPRTLAAVEASTAELEPLDPPAKVKQLRSPVSVAKQQVEDLVTRDPDRVAAQVRAWMSED